MIDKESREAWIKAATNEDLRAMVASGQVELMRRAMNTATLAFDHTAESLSAALDEVATLMEPTSAISFRVRVSHEDVNGFFDAGLMIPNGSEKVFPYLLESVHIESCPVIGKQREDLDFSEESI